MKNGRALGNRMEEIAARWLMARGCEILERQYRRAVGEVDLIYRDGRTLVFGEVKYRSSVAYGFPSEAVDGRKRSRIRRCAQWYCGEKKCENEKIRFDVIELLRQYGILYIRQIQDAF